VELVVVIVLVGILGWVGGSLIGNLVGGYRQAADRTAQAGLGRVAVERMAREIRQAVPNAVSVTESHTRITLLHAAGGGQYVAVGASDPDRDLNLVREDTFTAYGFSDLPDDDQLLVYPLHPGAVFDDLAGNTSGPRARIQSVGPGASEASASITLHEKDAFAYHSPGPRNRIYASDRAMSFCYEPGDRTVYIGAWPLDEDLDFACDPAAPEVHPLISPVADAAFHFQPGAQTRAGLVRISLDVATSNGPVSFQHEVRIRNVP
jgi:MSHA biogenesis protein MshO